jgi:hypothetical protein
LKWLREAVLRAHENLSEEMFGYALGRGLPSPLLREMLVGEWVPLDEEAPDDDFKEKNGARGEWRKGWLTIPYWTPAGSLAGMEFRTWGEGGKQVRDFRTPTSKWAPCYIGLTPTTLKKIWEGGDVWIVEGVFDLSITHAIPKRDVALACGTARLSRSQADFLARFLSPSATVHVAYDMDKTGRAQTEGYRDESNGKWIPGVPERLRRMGLKARAVSYRGGKDPGEIWEAGGKPLLSKMFRTKDLI